MYSTYSIMKVTQKLNAQSKWITNGCSFKECKVIGSFDVTVEDTSNAWGCYLHLENPIASQEI